MVVHEGVGDSRTDVEEEVVDVMTSMEEEVVVVEAIAVLDMEAIVTKSVVAVDRAEEITTVDIETEMTTVAPIGTEVAVDARSVILVKRDILAKKDEVVTILVVAKSVEMAMAALPENLVAVRRTQEIVDTMRGVMNATLAKERFH